MILHTNEPMGQIFNLSPPKSTEMNINGKIICTTKSPCGKNQIQRVISTDLATYLDKNYQPNTII